MPLRPLPLSIVLGAGVPGDFGLNVTCCPVWSTAVHCVLVGHATEKRLNPGSIVVGVGVGGLVELGSNVICCPMPPTAVHWLSLGQATAFNGWPASTATRFGGSVNAGSNVTCRPASSTAVHSPVGSAAEHATLFKLWPLSIVLADTAFEIGPNVTRCPTSSTATHSVVDRHATPARWLAASIGVTVTVELTGFVGGSNVTSLPALSIAEH